MAVAKNKFDRLFQTTTFPMLRMSIPFSKSFKDILQELMEAELDASLGYEKNQERESYHG